MKVLSKGVRLCGLLLCVVFLVMLGKTVVHADAQDTALFQVMYASRGYALDGSTIVVSLLDETGNVEVVLGESNRGEVEVPIDAVTHAGKSVRVDMTLSEEFQFETSGEKEKSVIFTMEELATGGQCIHSWVANHLSPPNLDSNLPEFWCYVGKELDLTGAYDPYNEKGFQISYNWNPVVCEYAYVTRAGMLEETNTRGVYKVLAEGTFYINFYYQGEYAQIKVNAKPLEDNTFIAEAVYNDVLVDGTEITFTLKDSREAESGTIIASCNTGRLTYDFTVAEHSGKYVQVDVELPEGYYEKYIHFLPGKNYINHIVNTYDIDSLLGAGYSPVKYTYNTTDVNRDGMLSVNMTEIPVLPVGENDIFTGAFNTDENAVFQVYYTAPDGSRSRVVCDSFECSGGTIYAADDVGTVDVRNAGTGYVWFHYGDLIYVVYVETSFPVTDLTLNKTKLELKIGETVQLTPIPTLITDVEISYYWMSMNTMVATVDQNGNVTAVNPGKGLIRVQALDGSYQTALCEVTVLEAGSVTTEEEQINSFVERMYTIILNRAADEGGLKDWAAELIGQRVDGAEIVSQFINSDEFKARNLSSEDYIKVLYRAILNREPAIEEVNSWLSALEQGQTQQDLLNGFVTSAEFGSLCDGYGIIAVMTQEDMVRNFVSRMYTVALERAKDEEGLDFWVSLLMNGQADGAAIADGFINSPEFEARNLSDEDYIKVLYLTFLNREADQAGIDSWVDALTMGCERPVALQSFIETAEFGALCEEYGIIATFN